MTSKSTPPLIKTTRKSTPPLIDTTSKSTPPLITDNQSSRASSPQLYLSVKRLPGHQALNLIEQRLQGIKPPTMKC
ncbi:hypothetical protein MTR_7g032425 [Medicago truncatula]|uniref:Uncharacterized protein n=1 Tax=Medicago truncatula TaxID=3880 RepID=A0A072TX59_MEDTR|nr:hypothetical protein MTR_7g032425 [Medicago truncatula]